MRVPDPALLCRPWRTARALRMREWPSIVPTASKDYYIVMNSYGRHSIAFAETDLDRADYQSTIADLISGQHWRSAARDHVQS
jgi:hypothetical protein